MTAWKDISRTDRPWVVYGIVRQLQPLAYGASIQRAIEAEYAKDISPGWLHIVLEGLEREGFLRREQKRHPDPEVDRSRGNRVAGFYFATGKPRPAPAVQQPERDDGFAGQLA